jgi:hypothetical protein
VGFDDLSIGNEYLQEHFTREMVDRQVWRPLRVCQWQYVLTCAACRKSVDGHCESTRRTVAQRSSVGFMGWVVDVSRSYSKRVERGSNTLSSSFFRTFLRGYKPFAFVMFRRPVSCPSGRQGLDHIIHLTPPCTITRRRRTTPPTRIQVVLTTYPPTNTTI